MLPAKRHEISNFIRNIITPGGRAFLPLEVIRTIERVASKSTISLADGSQVLLGEYWKSVPEDPLRGQKIAALSEIGKRMHSDFYRMHPTSYESPEVSLFYALYYLPRNFHKIQLALLRLFEEEGLPTELRVLDLGCGVGTASLALADFSLLMEHTCRLMGEDVPRVSVFCDCLDASRSNLVMLRGLHDELALSREHIQVRTNTSIIEPGGAWQQDIPLDGRYDLVIISNFLTELTARKVSPADRAKVVLDAAALLEADGNMIIIEPADQENVTQFHAVQEHLLHQGLRMVFPCRHLNSGNGQRCVDCWAFQKQDLRLPDFLTEITWDQEKIVRDTVVKWAYRIFTRKSPPPAPELSRLPELSQKDQRVDLKVQVTAPLINSRDDKKYLKVCGTDAVPNYAVVVVHPHQALPVVQAGDILNLRQVRVAPSRAAQFGSIGLYYDALSDAQIDGHQDNAALPAPKTRLTIQNSAAYPETLRYFLRRLFGFDDFRSGQIEVISEILAGRDTAPIMATSAGKSLCFQLPALLLSGVAVVVAPLLSLIQDQQANLTEWGLDGVVDNLSSDQHNKEKVLAHMVQGQYKILYITPEQLMNERVIYKLQETARREGISLFAVDEVHCLSQWGHDFRPAYMNLLRHFRDVDAGCPERGHTPVLALTATASKNVTDDVLEALAIDPARLIRYPVDRPRLSFEVIKTPLHGDLRGELRYKKLLELLRRQAQQAGGQKGPGIIFVPYTGNKWDDKHGWWLFSAEGLAERLKRDLGVEGWRISCHHSDLKKEDRWQRQHDFKEGKLDLLVATKGFGMGIDKNDVRLVIHFMMPESLDSYYQQAGRSGRDDRHAHCILLYAQPKKNFAPQSDFEDTDDHRLHFFIEDHYPKDKVDIPQVWRYLVYSAAPRRTPDRRLLYQSEDEMIVALGWMTKEELEQASIHAEDSIERRELRLAWKGFLEAVRSNRQTPDVSRLVRLPDGEIQPGDWPILLKSYGNLNPYPQLQSRLAAHPLSRKFHALAGKIQFQPAVNAKLKKKKDDCVKKLHVSLDAFRRMGLLYSWDKISTQAEYYRRLAWEEIRGQTRDQMAQQFIDARIAKDQDTGYGIITGSQQVDLVEQSLEMGWNVSAISAVLDHLRAFDLITSLRFTEKQLIIRFEPSVLALSQEAQAARLEAGIVQLYRRRDREYAMLESMQGYAETTACRRQSIVGYFLAEEQSKLIVRCNFCDNCCPDGIEGDTAQVEEATRRQATIVDRIRAWLDLDQNDIIGDQETEPTECLAFIDELQPQSDETPIWDLVQGIAAYHHDSRFPNSWRAAMLLLLLAGERKDQAGLAHWLARFRDRNQNAWQASYTIGNSLYQRYRFADEALFLLLVDACQALNRPIEEQHAWLQRLVEQEDAANPDHLERLAQLERQLGMADWVEHTQSAILGWVRLKRENKAAEHIKELIVEFPERTDQFVSWIDQITPAAPLSAVDIIAGLPSPKSAIPALERFITLAVDAKARVAIGQYPDVWVEAAGKAAELATTFDETSVEVLAWQFIAGLPDVSPTATSWSFRAHNALVGHYNQPGPDQNEQLSQLHARQAARLAPDEAAAMALYNDLLSKWEVERVAAEVTWLESHERAEWAPTLLLNWHAQNPAGNAETVCKILVTNNRFSLWNVSQVEGLLNQIPIDTLNGSDVLANWWLKRAASQQKQADPERLLRIAIPRILENRLLNTIIIPVAGGIYFDQLNSAEQDQLRPSLFPAEAEIKKLYGGLKGHFLPESEQGLVEWLKLFPVELIATDLEDGLSVLTMCKRLIEHIPPAAPAPEWISQLRLLVTYLSEAGIGVEALSVWWALCTRWPAEIVFGVDACLKNPDSDCLQACINFLSFAPRAHQLADFALPWFKKLSTSFPNEAILLLKCFIGALSQADQAEAIAALLVVIEHEDMLPVNISRVADWAHIWKRRELEERCWLRILAQSGKQPEEASSNWAKIAHIALARIYRFELDRLNLDLCKLHLRRAAQWIVDETELTGLYEDIILSELDWDSLQSEIQKLPQHFQKSPLRALLLAWYERHMDEPMAQKHLEENGIPNAWLGVCFRELGVGGCDPFASMPWLIRKVNNVLDKSEDVSEIEKVTQTLVGLAAQGVCFPEDIRKVVASLYFSMESTQEFVSFHQKYLPRAWQAGRMIKLIRNYKADEVRLRNIAFACLIVYPTNNLVHRARDLTRWVINTLAKTLSSKRYVLPELRNAAKAAGLALYDEVKLDVSFFNETQDSWEMISLTWIELKKSSSRGTGRL